jgi:hypothetical protein
MENYYKILDISEKASIEEIKRAYRSLARKYHPDMNQTSEAELMFKKINEAYKVLSNPGARRAYDEKLFYSSEKKEAQEERVEEKPLSKFSLFSAALIRIIVTVLGVALLGGIMELVIWYIISNKSFDVKNIIIAGIFGGIIGLIFSIDINFDIESFFGPRLIGKIYSFLRTTLVSLSFGYFGGILGFLLDKLFNKQTLFLTIFGFIFGILVGATLGSDGEAFIKMKSKAGRFNLLYTGLRGIFIGLIGSIVALVMALILRQLLGLNFIKPALVFGSTLGIILGCINPGNLAAYSSYTSAWLKNIILIILIVIALVIGIGIGVLLKMI